MSIEALSREVLAKVDIHREKLDSEFKNQTSLLDKEFEDLFLNYKEKLENSQEKSLELDKIKILGTAKKEAKEIFLETKSSLVKQVFDKTKENLYNLEANEKEFFLSKLLKKVKDSEFDFDKVYCNKDDLNFIKKSLPKKTIKAKSNLQGLIFETKSGDEVLDLSFDEILKEIFEENEDRVLSLLFNN